MVEHGPLRRSRLWVTMVLVLGVICPLPLLLRGGAGAESGINGSNKLSSAHVDWFRRILALLDLSRLELGCVELFVVLRNEASILCA